MVCPNSIVILIKAHRVLLGVQSSCVYSTEEGVVSVREGIRLSHLTEVSLC